MKQSLENELEREVVTGKPKFDLVIMTTHWSGCSGGYVPKKQIFNIQDTLDRQKMLNPWLNSFLKLSETIKICKISKAPISKKEIVSWDEFALRCEAENLDSKKLWVIVAFVDGQPLFRSDLEKSDKTIGNSDFKGWILNTRWPSPTVTFRYIKNSRYPNMPNLVEQAHFRKNGIITAHLLSLEKGTGQEVDLKKIVPIKTEIIIYGDK